MKINIKTLIEHCEDTVIGGMTYSKDWEVSVDDSPGHGADYNPSF